MKNIVPWCVLTAALLASGLSKAAPATPGLVDERPAKGHYVETDRGFMVPYRSTIPGTDVSFEMVPVPGGDYQMTRHGKTFTVKIEPFWMGKTEVSWAEYQKYMDLTTAFAKFDDQGIRQIDNSNEVDAITSPSKLYEPSFTFASGDDPDQPAVSMTQYAAKQYTKWLSLTTGQFFRLPSEAEWEYACGAGSAENFSFGSELDGLDEYGWFIDNCDYELGTVAEKKPNAWGLFDMHGNAAEWVLDAYEEMDDDPEDGSTVTVEESIAWPVELYPRVLKGGSWQHEAEECTTASRWASDDDEWRINDPNSPLSPWWFASDEGQQVGFRLLRPLVDAPRKEKEKYWQADAPRIMAHANRRIDEEGKGERGIADPELPKAIEKLD
ncbi:formylglycine-generating enzyme family protein [Aeoliella sp.]|uniref:formylglycine-generating enzyme family protein n=1 Tax=Aeoliella sp. TaxID=2795800 RepID=UPI003CCBBE8A